MHRPARAFTLVELVLALALSSMIVLGLAAALSVTLRAMPGASASDGRIARAFLSLDALCDRIAAAKEVASIAGDSLKFVSADGAAEREIEIAWSGSAGDPLVASVDGGPKSVLIEAVYGFKIEHATVTRTESAPGSPAMSAETLLASHVPTSNRSQATVTGDRRWAQWFRPTLPADAIGYVVTRVELFAIQDGPASEQTEVAILMANTNRSPAATALTSAVVSESALKTTLNWQSVSLPAHPPLTRDQPACIALSTSSGSSPSMRFDYRTSGAPAGVGGLTEGDPGWKSPATDKAMTYRVYGYIVRDGTPVVTSSDQITQIRLIAALRPDGSRTYSRTLRLLNAPDRP